MSEENPKLSVHRVAIWDAPVGLSTIVPGRGIPTGTPSYAQAGRGGSVDGPAVGIGCRVTGPVGRRTTGEILRLAVPAFLALVAEPLFLLADAAIVGHLGTPQLAGLGIAGAVLSTAGQPVRLPRLRHHRRGRPPGRRRRPARRARPGRRRPLAGGRSSAWSSTVAVLPLTRAVVALFGADAEVAGHAATYLRIALLGATPAAADARRHRRPPRPAGHPHARWSSPWSATPLNVVLNLALVYGSAWGWASPAPPSARCSPRSARRRALVVRRGPRRPAASGAPLRPDLAGHPRRRRGPA